MSESKVIHQIMVDIETVSTEPNAGIIGIGAYKLFTGETFKILISPESNEKEKRHISKETMQWWDKQDPEIRDHVFSGRTSLFTALYEYKDWVEKVTDNALDETLFWANGSEFDNVILKNAFEQITGHYPFNFRKHRCFRTLKSLVPSGYFTELNNATKHDPLADAIYQGKHTEAILKNLSWR